ncbi:GM24842 [Drosophila sechellia]|uniref:GM24842 n=1 Tax=Drosophila sechellia TaxID=7238 RepID=B4HLA6_DROSE|nr:GM24842 [Drosophila sechellia]
MQWQWTSPRGLVFGAPFEEKENFAKQEEHKTTKDAMGKCVSRQSAPLHELASPGAQHHQSVLTIALSHEDLAQAHKIWQRLTGSNEYIAAGPTSQQEEEPFYYTISRQRQPEQQQQREQELEQAVLHIESLYNDAAIAPAEPVTSASEPEYSTCQEFLLHELLQVIEEHAATTSAANHILNQSRIRPEPQLPVENNGWLALVSNIDKCLQLT